MLTKVTCLLWFGVGLCVNGDSIRLNHLVSCVQDFSSKIEDQALTWIYWTNA